MGFGAAVQSRTPVNLWGVACFFWVCWFDKPPTETAEGAAKFALYLLGYEGLIGV